MNNCVTNILTFTELFALVKIGRVNFYPEYFF